MDSMPIRNITTHYKQTPIFTGLLEEHKESAKNTVGMYEKMKQDGFNMTLFYEKDDYSDRTVTYKAIRDFLNVNMYNGEIIDNN